MNEEQKTETTEEPKKQSNAIGCALIIIVLVVLALIIACNVSDCSSNKKIDRSNETTSTPSMSETTETDVLSYCDRAEKVQTAVMAWERGEISHAELMTTTDEVNSWFISEGRSSMREFWPSERETELSAFQGPISALAIHVQNYSSPDYNAAQAQDIDKSLGELNSVISRYKGKEWKE